MKTDELGKDVFERAIDTLSDKISTHGLAEERRTGGSTGSSACATARSLRHSSREAMQRVVLEMMIEVNTFLTDGTFRMVRYAPENTPAEEATHGAESGLKRNAYACRMVHAELISYFTAGMSALITDGIPRVFCIRPTTSVRCGDCCVDFDPFSILSRDNLALCEQCRVLVCTDCYMKRAETLKNINNGKPLTNSVMDEHKELWRCVRCINHC